MMRESNLRFFGRVSLHLNVLMLKIYPRLRGIMQVKKLSVAVAEVCEH
jgi:hypothetical protein